jgi:hypothetical protein
MAQDQLRAIAKYLTSFLKADWSIADYPLRYREQTKTDPRESSWVVQIINWWAMTGVGESKEEAYRNLQERLAERRAAGARLPRPGKQVPIELASTNRVDRYPEIAERFLREVLGFASGSAVFISDQSSLRDFGARDSLHDYIEKTRQVFGTDVADIEGGNLADIFERLHQRERLNWDG